MTQHGEAVSWPRDWNPERKGVSFPAIESAYKLIVEKRGMSRIGGRETDAGSCDARERLLVAARIVHLPLVPARYRLVPFY